MQLVMRGNRKTQTELVMSLFATKENFESEAAHLPREEQEVWFYGSEEAYEDEVRRMRFEHMIKQALEEGGKPTNLDFKHQKDARCRMCKSNYLCRDTRQMRKGDEGMGVFFTCGKCGAQTIVHE